MQVPLGWQSATRGVLLRMAAPSRNLLICGTPGTGKTSLASELAQRTGWQHINISELVKERGLHTEYDEQFQSFVIDEDRVSSLCVSP
jgi:broad-specificity NMP kinase